MSRHAEIMARLEEALDPELDRSVVEMGFIQDVSEADGDVRVSFRLPTQWCAANFAFLMALDMRTAVESLPWVREVKVRLLDHFASGHINRAMAERRGFADVFPCEASGDLAEVRRGFGEKAYLARQDVLLRALVHERGVAGALALRMRDLDALAHGDGTLHGEALRYLAARRQFGGPALSDAPAFTDPSGGAVTPEGYADHARFIRRARGAAEANAEHCRLLMQARQVAPAPEDRSSPRGLYE